MYNAQKEQSLITLRGTLNIMKVEIVKQFPNATPKELRMREKEVIQSFPPEKLINKIK